MFDGTPRGFVVRVQAVASCWQKTAVSPDIWNRAVFVGGLTSLHKMPDP